MAITIAMKINIFTVIRWRLFWIACIILCFSLKANAQIVINFERDHDLKNALSSGIRAKEFPEPDGRKLFLLQAQNIIIILPGGQQIQANIESGSMKAEANGKLLSFDFSGQIFPADEAYEAALMVHHAFGIQVDRLNKWRELINGSGRASRSFANGQDDYYPNVFLEILNSMNSLYPWNLRIALSWNVEKDDKRDETWGTSHNVRTPKGLERVSIDAPSGKTYSRKDANIPLLKAQEELDRRLGQVRDANGFLVKPSPTPPEKEETPKPAPESKLETKPEPVMTQRVEPASTGWIAWSVAVIGVISGLWLWLRKRKSK